MRRCILYSQIATQCGIKMPITLLRRKTICREQGAVKLSRSSLTDSGRGAAAQRGKWNIWRVPDTAIRNTIKVFR